MLPLKVFFNFPGLVAGSDAEKAMDVVVAKFDAMPGIACTFGGSSDPCDGGYTHCLLVIADDVASLKSYLHSPEHLEEWIAAVKAHIKGIVVFDSELAVDFDPTRHACFHPQLLKLDVHDGTPIHTLMEAVVATFNRRDGVQVSLRSHLGPKFLEDVKWPDKAGGYTYCLTILAKDRPNLDAFFKSEENAAWLSAIRESHSAGDGSVLAFDQDLKMAARAT